MCGGFTCSRNTLIFLNLIYIVVGSLLIGTAVYGNRYTDLPILPSAIACGIVLIFLSILGLYGAAKHHQVALFFYMIILFCLFIVQFAIACSCLAVNKHQQEVFARNGWEEIDDDLKSEVQNKFQCCGFNDTKIADHPACDTVNKFCCDNNKDPTCTCPPCLVQLEKTIDSAFRVTGTIGLLFSFSEIITIVIARNYRNMRDPCNLPIRAVFPTANYQYR